MRSGWTLAVAVLSAWTIARAEAAAPCQPPAAARAVTKAQMVAFVEEAAAYLKTAGRDAALKEFSDPKGKFVRAGGELYLYAYDFDGVCRAHGFTPELVGKDLTDKRDARGLLVIQKLRETVVRDGQGFVEFGWVNPTTGKEGRKLGYVVKIDDTLWLGSGMYLPDAPAGK